MVNGVLHWFRNYCHCFIFVSFFTLFLAISPKMILFFVIFVQLVKTVDWYLFWVKFYFIFCTRSHQIYLRLSQIKQKKSLCFIVDSLFSCGFQTQQAITCISIYCSNLCRRSRHILLSSSSCTFSLSLCQAHEYRIRSNILGIFSAFCDVVMAFHFTVVCVVGIYAVAKLFIYKYTRYNSRHQNQQIIL